MACSTYRRKVNTHDPKEGTVAEDARQVRAAIQSSKKAEGGGGGRPCGAVAHVTPIISNCLNGAPGTIFDLGKG